MLFFNGKGNILSRLYKMHLKHTILHKKKQKKTRRLHLNKQSVLSDLTFNESLLINVIKIKIILNSYLQG